MAVKKKPQKYQQANAYYSHGSEAYEIEREYDPSEKAVKRKKTTKRQQSVKTKLAMQRRANRLNSIKIVMVLAVFFCGTLAFMWSSALVTEQRVETQKYKDKLNELKNENALLAADVSEQMDLENVKKIATEKLGMVEPQPYQIKYIDVPEQSYTIHYEDDNKNTVQQESENTLVRTIVGLFKKE